MRRRALVLLGAAAVAGIVLGRLSVDDAEAPSSEASSGEASSGEAVARVGEVDLLDVEVDTVLRESGTDPESATPAERAEALERLIDEELWLRAALEQDLLREHRGAREAVVRRVLDAVHPAGEAVDEDALQRLYDETYGADADAPALEKVRFRLEDRLLRQRNEQALEDYLAWLRQTTEVEIDADPERLRALADEVRETADEVRETEEVGS